MDLQEAWGREQAARGTELLAASWRSSSHSWLQSLLGSPSPGVVVELFPRSCTGFLAQEFACRRLNH